MEGHSKNLPWRLFLIKLCVLVYIHVCVYIYLYYICMCILYTYVYVEGLKPHTCKIKGAILKYSPALEIDKLFSNPINM